MVAVGVLRLCRRIRVKSADPASPASSPGGKYVRARPAATGRISGRHTRGGTNPSRNNQWMRTRRRLDDQGLHHGNRGLKSLVAWCKSWSSKRRRVRVHWLLREGQNTCIYRSPQEAGGQDLDRLRAQGDARPRQSPDHHCVQHCQEGRQVTISGGRSNYVQQWGHAV